MALEGEAHVEGLLVGNCNSKDLLDIFVVQRDVEGVVHNLWMEVHNLWIGVDNLWIEVDNLPIEGTKKK